MSKKIQWERKGKRLKRKKITCLEKETKKEKPIINYFYIHENNNQYFERN